MTVRFEQGVLVTARARCGWTLDGGALHLHGFSGDSEAIAPLVAEAERIALERFAAVCITTLEAGDPWAEALARCGFERDDAELTVRNGEVRTELTLVRTL